MNAKKKNKISVVIPSYNRVCFLSRAINSILNQSHQVNEIILVDNGSNDGTVSFIKEKYKMVKVIYEKKKGVSYARNTGIEKSKNDWIAFLDSDDEWLPNKIKEQFDLLKKNKYNLNLIHTNEIWFKNGVFQNQKKKHEKKGGYIFESCLNICKISPSSVIIKKKTFNEYGLFDTKFKVCEDYELWLRLTSKFKVGYINTALIKKYAGHSDQLSKKYWGIDRYRIKALEKIILKGNLSFDQKQMVLNTLLKKIDIVLLGAINRINHRVLRMYAKKKFLWRQYHYKYTKLLLCVVLPIFNNN